MSTATSQPGEAAVEAFNAALAKAGESEPQTAAPEIPAAPEAEAPPPEVSAAPAPAPFDPATIRIPEDASLPKHAEKYKGKALPEIFDLSLKTEQWASEKAAEAARYRRENEEVKARLAAMEQWARVQQQPQAPPQDPWAQAGINPDEHLFTNPRQVLDVAVQLAEQRSRQVAAETAQQTQQAFQTELRKREEAGLAIATFESAKAQVRSLGYEISDQEWVQALEYIAPVIARENEVTPGVLFDTNRYVRGFTSLRGAPVRATLPQEGNPPVATRPATAPQSPAVPTVSREKRELYETIGRAMASRNLMSEDQVRDFAARAGGN